MNFRPVARDSGHQPRGERLGAAARGLKAGRRDHEQEVIEFLDIPRIAQDGAAHGSSHVAQACAHLAVRRVVDVRLIRGQEELAQLQQRGHAQQTPRVIHNRDAAEVVRHHLAIHR